MYLPFAFWHREPKLNKAWAGVLENGFKKKREDAVRMDYLLSSRSGLHEEKRRDVCSGTASAVSHKKHSSGFQPLFILTYLYFMAFYHGCTFLFW